MNNITSLCIPRIEETVKKDYIFKVFQKLKIGYIQRIIEIPLRNDTKHKRIIILLQLNTINPIAQMIEERVSKNESIKLVYDMPWYWKIVPTIMPQK
jgi:hypothetical protein